MMSDETLAIVGDLFDRIEDMRAARIKELEQHAARIEVLEQQLESTVDARTDEDIIRIVEIAARADPGATAYYLRRAGLIGDSIGINQLELILL